MRSRGLKQRLMRVIKFTPYLLLSSMLVLLMVAVSAQILPTQQEIKTFIETTGFLM